MRGASGLLGRAVDADDDGVVTLVGLKRQLLLGLQLLGLHLVDLACKDSCGLGRRVNAACLFGVVKYE